LVRAAAPPRLHVPLEKYRLPNGLTVILHEDHRAPTVVVDLWFRVGSKDERPGRTGFAHLFEHLMFMGTSAVPNGQFDAIMEAAGGSNNATTSEDRTNYFESGPSNLLETFLWLEADRLSTLADDMTQEKLDLQRDVVKNERRQSYENRPYGKVELVLPEHLWPAGHAYHHNVIGSHEDLSAATVEDVKDFFRTYYVASNASLVVSGDFKSAEARKMIDRYFAALQKKPVPPHVAPRPAELAKSETVEIADNVQLDRVTLAWHSPAAFTPGDAEGDLLAALLAPGKSSRLYRRLVYEKKIAQSVSAEQRGLRGDGMFLVVATAQPGHAAAELEAALDEELKALVASPPTAAEVERARATIETQLLRQLERPFAVGDLLNGLEFYLGDPRAIEERLLARYEKATAADVARVAKEILGRPRVSVRVLAQTAAKAPAKEDAR
jgi:zinc protease